MAYNVSYTTLPTFTTNSIGNTIVKRVYDNSGNNAWATSGSITLNPGVYNVSANYTCSNSPNGYMYILCDSSLNTNLNSIWSFDGTTSSNASFTLSNFGVYNQRLIQTNLGDFINNNNYGSWIPICSVLSITPSSYPNAGSCSLDLQVNKTVNIALVYFNQSGSSKSSGTLITTRIS
jgi:hypothetical protein